MKTFVRYLTIFILISLLAACGAPATQVPDAADSGTDLTAAEQWAKEHEVGPYTPETEDWGAIEAAAKEEGSVVVYANSSRFEKLLEDWNALYPDIALEGGDTDDVAVKMAAEQEAGNIVGDVWFNSDGHLLYGEAMPNQWIWWYTPPGVVMDDVTPERPFALARRSVDVIGYNSEVHPDGCPASNWWQFTEPELKGKFYLEDPISDSSTTAKIALIVQHADEMAAAYEKLYGKAWTEDEAERGCCSESKSNNPAQRCTERHRIAVNTVNALRGQRAKREMRKREQRDENDRTPRRDVLLRLALN